MKNLNIGHKYSRFRSAIRRTLCCKYSKYGISIIEKWKRILKMIKQTANVCVFHNGTPLILIA